MAVFEGCIHALVAVHPDDHEDDGPPSTLLSALRLINAHGGAGRTEQGAPYTFTCVLTERIDFVIFKGCSLHVIILCTSYTNYSALSDLI